MPRNKIDGIINWKRRRDAQPYHSPYLSEIEKLLEFAVGDDGQAFLVKRFAPIRVVTILEVFTREALARLIDELPGGQGRASSVCENPKIDIASFAQAQGASVTLGEIAAHSIKTNSFDDIVSSFQRALPEFRTELCQSFPRWKDEIAQWPLPPIISDFGKIAKSLSAIFDLRHIITHELPSESFLEKELEDKLMPALFAASTFIEAAEWVVVHKLDGPQPRTQTQMTIDALDNMRDMRKKTADCLRSILRLEILDRHLLNRSQLLWRGYAQLTAELAASPVRGGSMWSMVYYLSMAELLEKRVAYLESISNES